MTTDDAAVDNDADTEVGSRTLAWYDVYIYALVTILITIFNKYYAKLSKIPVEG